MAVGFAPRDWERRRRRRERLNVGSVIKGSGRSGASSRGVLLIPRTLRTHPASGRAAHAESRAAQTFAKEALPATGTGRRRPRPAPRRHPHPLAGRETYEEDREYESQAKRLKTEEGEIDYSAEEGENRREATPRGGGDSGGGGGGRSFSQPVTKRGAPTAVPGGSPGSRAQRQGLGLGASRPPRFPFSLR
ncbi:hypothetical protein J1605_016740 [Eschrichtius robustus]|uniref:Uncharacterized protein n=1 Tax=Eschrichtius robustus TaxID=9764 RepID=A0AB34I093_ESCRO|nr:hypothetical protein J1605_016740 [Eschrichtius robustus]